MMEGLVFISFFVVGSIILLLAAWLLNEAWEILRAVVRRRVKVVRGGKLKA